MKGVMSISTSFNILPIEYSLQTYHRSNQDTTLLHRPVVKEGDWVQAGDLISDSGSSTRGEFSIGQNLLIAYLPWEGYNYEDAILISERLVYDDLYTSIHIERYDISAEKTPHGNEIITKDILLLKETNELDHLDENGVAKLGSWLKEGDILVGKITPTEPKKEVARYIQLYNDILGKKMDYSFRDTSLRMPRGLEAKVIRVQLFPEKKKRMTKISSCSVSRNSSTGYKRKIEPSYLHAHYKGLEIKQKLFSQPMNKKSIAFSFQKSILINRRLTKTRARFKFGQLGRINPHMMNWDGTKMKRIENSRASYKSGKVGKKIENVKDKLKTPKMSAFFVSVDRRLTEGFVKKSFATSLNLKIKGDRLAKPKFSQNDKKRAKFELLKNRKNLFFILYDKRKATRLNPNRSVKSLLLPNPKVREPGARLSKPEVVLDRRREKGQKKSLLSPVSTFIHSVHVYLAEKRKVQVGDKMAGRHGNKGIISQILPRQDMPYLPDGSPIDLALNPLGVPSRMNVGQIYECLLGLAGKNLGEQYRIKPFDESFGSEASRSFVFSKLYEARCKTGQSWLFQPINPGKLKLFDGRTGNRYDQPITTGYSYMIKLVHLVDEKIHSRSSGPYSLITQQPLKGRSKHGGQRLGEMEVWAIEAYGAAFILLELLTIKSDDVTGRLTIWDYILYKKPLYIGTPASFKVLICELQALCLDIGIYKADPSNALKQIHVSTMG